MEFLKNLIIKKEIKKDFNFIFEELKNKKISEIKFILSNNNEIKNKAEKLIFFFEWLSWYWMPFLDEEPFDNIKTSNIIKLKEEQINFIERIRKIVQFNQRIIKKWKVKLNINNPIDLDFIYDVLTNPKYELSEEELYNLYKGLIKKANDNISSEYIIEITELFVKHSSFNKNVFQKILKNITFWQNLSNSYIKVLIIFKYLKRKDYLNNFFRSDKQYRILFENFLISPYFDDIKESYISKLDIDLLKELEEKLKNNINLQWRTFILTDIRKNINLKENCATNYHFFKFEDEVKKKK